MLYLLAILLIILLIYIITNIINKERKIEKEISLILESRLKYTEREYQRTQEQFLDFKFKEWLRENEFDIRRTAIRQMSSNIVDNISKELSIVKNNFAFNPKDIKFTGRFIDLIIFDGAANEEIVNIYFIDIQRPGFNSKYNFKTKVFNAIKNGNVSFQEINL